MVVMVLLEGASCGVQPAKVFDEGAPVVFVGDPPSLGGETTGIGNGVPVVELSCLVVFLTGDDAAAS